MKPLFRAALTVLVALSTATDFRAAAPANLAGRIYYQNASVSIPGMRSSIASALAFRDDGTVRELYRLVWNQNTWTPTEPVDGEFQYERTGENSGTLKLRLGGAAMIEKRLVFDAEDRGTVEPEPISFTTENFTLSDTTSSRGVANLALRATVQPGAEPIAGFVVTGNKTRTVLVRAVGPGLATFGVPRHVRDPRFSIPQITHANVVGPVFANDNWASGNSVAAVRRVETATGAFPLSAGSTDAALIVPNVAPGAYTVNVTAAESSDVGEVLIEVYLLP